VKYNKNIKIISITKVKNKKNVFTIHAADPKKPMMKRKDYIWTVPAKSKAEALIWGKNILKGK